MLSSARRLKIKRIGAGAALAAALLSATGCGYIHQQPTTIHYDASDGVSAKVGDVQMEDLLVLTNSATSEGRLIGTVINNGNHAVTVDFTATKSSARITVPANSQVELDQDSHKVLFNPAGAEPGVMLSGTKISVGSQSTTTDIPVLDGALPEYSSLVPGGSDYTPPSAPTEESH